MPGFAGKTVTEDAIPTDVQGLRGDMASFLQNQLGSGLMLGAPDLAPFQELFRRQNINTFAQAKESAGTLTGSGYGNMMGRAAGDAATQQGAFLADMLNRNREANAQRLQNYFIPMLTAGVGPPQTSYQPGFLDYAIGGAAAVAPGVGAYYGRR